jgi:hypothetical protein
MNAKTTARGALPSNEELALRVAELELRVAAHDEILNFLKTILEQLKESGYRLVLTRAQRAELNRWLDACETNMRSRMRSSQLN